MLFSIVAVVSGDDLVLKVRRADCCERDFIEVELNTCNKTFAALMELICEELHVDPDDIYKVRKLPNTIIRKDKDVARLTDFQEIEVVIVEDYSARSPRVDIKTEKTVLY